jgi:hypothetical protein
MSPTAACVTSGRNLWSPFPTLMVCVCTAAVVVGLGFVSVVIETAGEEESCARPKLTR